jgi:flagellin
MRINHNISAMNTYRQYSANAASANKSMEKLSSGSRINRAADDAAGLSISEKMRSQIRGLTQAKRNAEDGVSFLQTAEGALTEVSDMLTRLKELAVQVQNGTYSEDDKKNIGAEMNALGKAITDIYVNTKFNGKAVFGVQTPDSTVVESGSDIANAIEAAFTEKSVNYIKFVDGSWKGSGQTIGSDPTDTDHLTFDVDLGLSYGLQGLDENKVYMLNSGVLSEATTYGTAGDAVAAVVEDITTGSTALAAQNGSGTAAVIAYGEDAGQKVTIAQAATTNIAALTAMTDLAKNSETAAMNVTVSLVEAAISEVNTTRAGYGAQQNQLEHASNNMATTKENLQSAESRVRDVDMAEEMMEYTKDNILLQAAQSMLAQANSQPQGILQLLQ